MKICRFVASPAAEHPHLRRLAGPRYGVLEADMVRLLSDPFRPGPLIPGDLCFPREAVQLLAPCRPGKIIAIGRNYAAHAAEHGAPVPERPMIFLKAPSALIGPGDEVVLPPESARVEHEGELAIVMGRRARRVSKADAASYVLGYTCHNDVTARDLQRADVQFARAKGFDTFAPLGPVIDTEIDPSDLRVQTRVNGAVRQDARTSQMVFDVATLIAYITAGMTLEPGDVIATGTPEGVGPLAHGDVVEVEIEGIGCLRNPVVAESVRAASPAEPPDQA